LVGGVLLGLIGAIVQVTAISRVVEDMGDVAKVAGYAIGVGIGVLVACFVSLAPDAIWTIERISSSRGLLAVASQHPGALVWV
jgi:hypothetical protein